ncbi:hypothetical protein LCGC14_2584640, partial [marine sediment metagenome]
MKPVFIGVHGFNTNGKYIRLLEPYLNNAGYGYCPFIYGKVLIGPIGNMIVNRIRTDDIASRLISMIGILQQPVILIGHSNGVMLAWMVSNECENVIGVIALNGALDADTKFKPWVINCYHPDDWVLKFAKVRPFSKWGDYGARKSDTAMINIDLRNYFEDAAGVRMTFTFTTTTPLDSTDEIKITLPSGFGVVNPAIDTIVGTETRT